MGGCSLQTLWGFFLCQREIQMATKEHACRLTQKNVEIFSEMEIKCDFVEIVELLAICCQERLVNYSTIFYTVFFISGSRNGTGNEAWIHKCHGRTC